MTKIPVGATIAQAYGFGFRNFLRILGVMWLAMAIMWIPGLLMRGQMMALATHDPVATRALLPFLIPFYIAAMILMFMQIIGIAKLALGTYSGSRWYYFSLGRPVWRLIGSLLLLVVAIIIGGFAVLLADLILGLLEKLLIQAVNFPAFTATMRLAGVILALATWCAYFYCLVRLSFLLAPVVAAEMEGLALDRAWKLGKGNFWRMFAILIAIILPFMLLEGGVLLYLFHGISLPVGPAQAAAFQAAMTARTAAMMRGIYHYWYLVYPPAIAVMVLFYGIAVGAQCFAWRSLMETGSDPVAGG